MSITDCFKCFNAPRVFEMKGMHYVSCRSCDLANANFDKDECHRTWNNRSSIERLYAELVDPGALKISEFKIIIK